MRGYISLAEASGGKVPLEGRTEIYRDPGDSERILVETDEQTVTLDVADVTVSRKKDGVAPVVVEPKSEHVEVRNNGNANGVTVVTAESEFDVAEGLVESVRRDARVEVGYQTQLRIEVERTAHQEINIEGSEVGDVVVGDQTNVDQSTTVGDDNVINRSEIGDEGTGVPAASADAPDRSTTVGDDNVMNRTTVGESGATGGGSTPDDDSTTQKFCEEHQRTYTDECPECLAEESKYCLYCGEEIPAVAKVCPACGESLPET